MEHLQEFKDEVEIVEEEAVESPGARSSSVSDLVSPTRGMLPQPGRGSVREIQGAICASLGTVRPLVRKLDMLLLAPPRCCSSKRIKDGMHLLKDDIENMRSYLDDLSEVEDPPPTAICWMNEVRDLSYDMEDYIDSLLFVLPEHPSVPNNLKTTRPLRKLSSHAKTPKTQFIIAEMLSEFRMYVQEAIERHQRYNLHSCSTLRRRFVSLGPMLLPTPYKDTANIVIDGRMNKFINSLANDGDQQLKVLPVLGSACLGKTTLARVLYKRFGKRYDCRAFIRVSKKPDMKRTFRDMLSQLQRQNLPQDCEEIDLVDNIKQYLQHKRYLIILDDVWAASVWDIIKCAFPNGSYGSRIITTTQIEEVALTCCCYQVEHVFELKPLDDDHSRKLFFNRLFRSESYCPEQFKEVSNEIVEICGGLPLATISIASLLASQPVISIDLLTYIHHSLCSLSPNSTSERLRQILNLSFNNLPHYLKTCLLYLSMYPESYKFWTDDLVKQWMAEGFIDSTEGQDMYKVAGSYLGQLIGRGFIQPIWINHNNEVLSCAVHEAVHDLIAHKSAEETFIVAINYSQKNVTLSYKARRLSLLFGDARFAKTPANITKSTVRSLRFFGLLESMPCIREFKLIRVLNLQLCGRPDNYLADLTMISELLQLRYLKIACDIYIKLPNHGLECLETLDITDAKVVYTVPWDINLPHLLHLSLPLEKRLLDGIGSTRSRIVVSDGRLNCMENLHLTPSVFNLERSMEALANLVGGHGNLRTVVVAPCSSARNIVEHGASEVFISWDCLEPPPLLQRFECSPRSCIIFYNIPKWVGKLGNLCILNIAVMELRFNSVDILRGLPALTALSLYVQRAPIERILFDKAGFLVLKYFKLRFTSGIAWLTFEEDAMPNLWKLKLVFNAIPGMDKHLLYSSNQGTFKQHQRGTAVISIEHMPGLREISVKFGGAAADVEYALRTFVSSHQRNPTINMQSVDNSSYGDGSTKQEQQPANEILDEEQDEHSKTLEGTADKRSPVSSRYPGQLNSSRLHVFTLDEILSATNNFSAPNFLYGNRDSSRLGVYKGSLNSNLRPDLARQQVIIIRYPDKPYENDRGWLSELEYLGTVHHPDLVKLVGFCDLKKHRMLVYEFTSMNSLQNYILNDRLPDGSLLTRIKIAVGAAKLLAFLHDADKPMVHGSLEASGIILDSDYTVKLLGFRLAKESPRWYDMEAMVSRGFILTKENDVYNFGVVLLELLTGRAWIETKYTVRRKNLVKWSRPYLRREDKLYHLLDCGLHGECSMRAAWCIATITRQCLNSVPKERPRMRDVVFTLESLLALSDIDRPTTLASGIEQQSKTAKWSQFFVKKAKLQLSRLRTATLSERSKKYSIRLKI